MKGAAGKFDMELFFRAMAERARLRLINLMDPDGLFLRLKTFQAPAD